MTFFVPLLKQRGYLAQIHLTLCIVGSRKLDEFIHFDYSQQGWHIFAPNLTIYGFDADEEACDRRNQELENQQINWEEKHIPLAVWNQTGTATLYVTKHPGCCSLYPPNSIVVERFHEYAERHKLMGTVEIKTTTLDEYFADHNRSIDFLQLDVQGGELNVLQGAVQLLKQQVLAIESEVNFIELYQNQPLFSEVDSYLRHQEFTLFDFGKRWYAQRQEVPMHSRQHIGQLVWTDAFYFRDLVRLDQNLRFKTPQQILKSACIADILHFYDYALEALGYLTLKYGENPHYNLTDCLVETLEQNPEATRYGVDSIPLVAKLKKLAHP
jgi:FkbM family methyltransferase